MKAARVHPSAALLRLFCCICLYCYRCFIGWYIIIPPVKFPSFCGCIGLLAEYVASLVKERFGIQNILINYVSPTIGAHSGPGTVALFFMGDQR
jgi:hypothetical protein